MKMIEKWGYKIAEYPREKGTKIVYKDGKYTCLVHDASYNQCIEITGDFNEIQKVFNTITDLSVPSISSNRYKMGNRMGNTKIYNYKQYPCNTISPISFLWKAIKNNNNEDNETQRTLWIWVHPSSCKDVMAAINQAKENTNINNFIMKLLDNEILKFELTGPRSHAILHKILRLCDDDFDNIVINKKAHETWKILKHLRSPISLQPGVAIALTVHDPRLFNNKKMEARAKEISENDQKNIDEICMNWPEDIAMSDIWDENLRERLEKNKVTEAELNDRRSKSLIPGTELVPLPNDSKIPILLVQRGLNNYKNDSLKMSQEFLCGWDMFIPKSWGMTFLKPLVFSGARVIGLNNIYELHFESNIPCYPYDYIETTAYKNYIEEKEKVEEEKYNKRPPAKRENYKKHGILSPFRPPFETLIDTIVSTIKEEKKQDTEMKDFNESENKKLWVVNTPKLISYLIEKIKDEKLTLKEINEDLDSNVANLFKQHNIEIENTEILTRNNLNNAFLRVSISLLGKGVVNDNSIIYSATKNDYNTYIKNKSKIEKENTSVYPIGKFPKDSSIIGYVTTGHYSLNGAHGKAIGCCTINGIRDVILNNKSNKSNYSTFVLVRDPKGKVVRPAVLRFLS